MKRCLIEHPKYQLSTAQNHNFYFTLSRISYQKKNQCYWGWGEEGSLVYWWWKCKCIQPLFGGSSKNCKQVWPSSPTPGSERDNCMPIFIAVFFTTVGYGNNLCAHLQVNKENVHITQP